MVRIRSRLDNRESVDGAGRWMDFKGKSSVDEEGRGNSGTSGFYDAREVQTHKAPGCHRNSPF